MDPLLGSITLWPVPWTPAGYALCNGAVLPLNQNQALYALLGTRYGGDGVNTFGLPDFRNRVPRGLNNVTDPPTLGGSDTYAGNATGSTSITLTVPNLPPHNHSTPSGNISISIPVSVDNTANIEIPGPTTVLTRGTVTSGLNTNPTKQYTAKAASTNLLPFNAPLPASNTGSTGTGTPLLAPVSIPLLIPTLPAYCPINFIIATVGIFPSRN